MLNPPNLNALIQKLCAAVPSHVQAIETDLHDAFSTILQAGFAELDLVTREEFDAQVKVLARTRAKVEALQAQLDQISKA